MNREQPFEIISPSDLDVSISLPSELLRIVSQGLVDLSPWHVMPRELANTRMAGMRMRYRTKYVPFARRQDNDDVACIDPEKPDRIIIIHDFSSEGAERVAVYEAFWDWFRAAIDTMIAFEP